MTLRQTITAAAAVLATNPDLRENATRDAELLLLHDLGTSRAQLLAYPNRELTEEEGLFYWQSIYRRLAGEPIQYIAGHQEFYGVDFIVTADVLIPRPETEHLVEAVLQKISSNECYEILDVGTGSGILAIVLALNLPFAQITALDISVEAIAVARRNAERHNVADRITFLESDLLSAIDHKTNTFDAIVSNPPYIPASDRSTLHPQVRDYEPATALFAGESGLDIYRRLIPQAYAALKPGGLLAMEIGHGQERALTELLDGWQSVSFIKDLQQIPRVVLSTKAQSPPERDHA
jgi:release factor glutamine methyltransferase